MPILLMIISVIQSDGFRLVTIRVYQHFLVHELLKVIKNFTGSRHTAACHQIFISLYLKAFIQNLVQIGTVVSEKIQVEFLYIHDLGPRSRNDIEFHYSHIFIYSIGCRTTTFQVTGCNSF